jgi:outer membrane biogenesis lipoprotein LolB
MNARYLTLALLLLAACGHQTSLVRPKDIPEYEKQRQEKREKYEPYREAE